ncbi:MAG: glycosyltransferase [Chthoniobacteraceae bacterium]|nr:glycosyltransferase [Chthoniobacteraceae bacterium]
MKRPLVTVCVPVYNTAAYIRQCIESVFAQECKDWILLVSDNCSTDGTWEILQELQHPQLRLFRQTQNIGPNANWNFLLEKVETDYFCFLGSDDYFYPNHLGEKIRLLEQYPEAPFVHGRTDFVDENGEKIQTHDYTGALPPTETSREALARLVQANYMVITAAVFRLAALRDNGICFDRRLRLFGDWDLYIELLLRYPLVVHDQQTTLAYRVHSRSDTKQNIKGYQWAMEAGEIFAWSFEEHRSQWEALGFDTAKIGKRKTARLWALAFQQLRGGHFSNAKRAWRCYRKAHSPVEPLLDIPRWLADSCRRATHQ